MPIVNFRTKRPLSAREIKSEIMRLRGWSAEEYNREYDKLRNRVRNYETATGQARGSIKVNELLYTTTRARGKYGAGYAPKRLAEAVMLTPSTAPAAFREQAETRGISERTANALTANMKAQFGKLATDPRYGVADQLKGVTDPKKVYEILTRAADEVKTYKQAFARAHGIKDWRLVGSP